MSSTDYVVDILLILVIFRQIRARELSLRSIALPLVIVAYAGVHYLHSFNLGGEDLPLIAFFAVIGVVLGTWSALATRVWRVDGQVLAQAGVLAATTWTVGMGFRFAFALYANSSGGARAVGRFSVRHSITGAQVWTTALVLMAFGEVLARVAVLQWKRIQLRSA